MFSILCAGVSAPRSGARNLKLAKLLRFRACQHGGTYEARPAFDPPLLVADGCCRPESDHRNPCDSCPPVTGKRAVLGRFMRVEWTAAATPTAIQSFWRFLGRRPGGFWGDRQRESPRYRQKERVRETEREEPPDYSHAPPSSPRKDATVKIVVVGDANADCSPTGLKMPFPKTRTSGSYAGIARNLV